MEEKALSLLILDDNHDDAELAVNQLEQGGFNVKSSRVDTEEGFRKALDEKPDLILADCKLPSFDGRAALQMRQQMAPDIPLIIFSGTIGEEVAVECMKSGARDYVFKDRLFRLGPAVKRAIEEAEAYRQCKRAEESLRESEGRYRTLIDDVLDSSDVGIFILNSEFRVVWVNRALERYFGFKRDEVIGKDKRQIIREGIKDIFEDPETFCEKVLSTYDDNTYIENFECRVLPEGNRQERWLEHWSQPIRSGLYQGGRIEHYTNITEFKRFQGKLRESEAFSSSLLSNSPHAIIVINPDSSVRYVGPSLEKLTGFSSADLIGKKAPYPWWTEETLQKTGRDFEKAMVKGAQRLEELFQKKDGDRFCVEITSTPVRSNGKLQYYLANWVDITERKWAEEALFESVAQKQALLDGLPDMIMQIDTNMTVLWANKTALDMNPDSVGQTCHKAYVNGDDPCQGCPCMRCMDTGQIERGVMYQPAVKGIQDESHWEDIGVPIKDNHGRIVGAIEIARNVTDRKKTEQKLRETRDYLENLINHVSAPIIVWDPEFRITRFNNAFQRLTGYATDEVIGQEFRMLFPEGSRRESVNKITRTLSGEYWKSVEIPILRKDGDVRHVLCNSSNVYADDGTTLLSTIVQGIDITKQKHLEAQLRQTQKMEALGTLAGGIAHDFNNILFAVIGYAELALDHAPKGSLLQSHLQEVVKAGSRAKDLVKQILTFSRQAEHELKAVQVKLIVKETLKLLRPSLPTTIEIRQNIQSDSVVLADPTQIHQVFMNLCTNAAHAMREEGGTLEVSLHNADFGFRNSELEQNDEQSAIPGPDLTHGRNRVFQSRRARVDRDPQSAIGFVPGPHLRLTVSDTGHGMTPDVLERIFDPFFTTKEPGEGTGMGLSVVHGIVKSLGGTITVDSQPGKGSTFRIYLPLAERELEPEVETEKTVPTGDERILFIDDEQVLANMGKQMLDRLGYEVASRTSSIEALELFRAQPDRFDLVITDMTMPNMTGEKLAAEIMNIRPDIPIILCTGFSKHISEEKAKEMGIRAFIMKPLARRDLADTIRKVLDE
ncbi:MAG: hypothetical protein BA872_06220 [Desulfobacterales bacterium C00003060]|nr:MAG: hypothetical protein BA872_06220 [Desulfobacterales bacterium C00003060]